MNTSPTEKPPAPTPKCWLTGPSGSSLSSTRTASRTPSSMRTGARTRMRSTGRPRRSTTTPIPSSSPSSPPCLTFDAAKTPPPSADIASPRSSLRRQRPSPSPGRRSPRATTRRWPPGYAASTPLASSTTPTPATSCKLPKAAYPSSPATPPTRSAPQATG